ncbi:hypothetical protein BUZ84_05610 [Mammaliicoccus sciuri]|uniref:hypothetical protein n=1 Tax=Mammaliicoccus sciuri TaxID=1296 RepID=UPI000D1E09D5|nr:hypothetical protein [Mammaliicoccus sciuri]MBO1209172.1 hypothetical protein [Mammaliicoccus sciuri]PTJ81689.1 hypothetical protein BUZ84_05610 [Mammaliicoccus sciuri]
MKREPVFIKPTYKYKDKVKEHPIERLEFRDVPENDIEKVTLLFRRFVQNFSEAFSGVGRH